MSHTAKTPVKRAFLFTMIYDTKSNIKAVYGQYTASDSDTKLQDAEELFTNAAPDI